MVDEYTGESEGFHERHYNEFVTFLPYVQRFLYGEGRSADGAQPGDPGPPMRVFRRHDVARVRAVTRPGDAPVMLDIVHVDLYFFFDVDVVMLNVEVTAGSLELTQAQDLMYRFGRAYPAGWDDQGHALHCLHSVEWLAADGNGAGRVRRSAARCLSEPCRRSSRTADRQPLGLHASPAGQRPERKARRAALSADRVLPDADDGLSGDRRSDGPDAQ